MSYCRVMRWMNRVRELQSYTHVQEYYTLGIIGRMSCFLKEFLFVLAIWDNFFTNRGIFFVRVLQVESARKEKLVRER